MSIKIKALAIILLLLSLVFSSSESRAQYFEERGYRGELNRWNYFPIDSLWQYHSGNETSIQDINNGTESWQLVNSELLQDQNGKPLKNVGIGWFRKTFEVPAIWRGKPVALRMGHFGASEVYLDGKLISRYGRVGSTIEQEKIFIPRKAAIIQLDTQASHVFLVRYSNMHANLPGYQQKFIGFKLLMAPPDVPFQIEVSKISTPPITIGILLTFSVFFLGVYFFYPTRIASLLTAWVLLNFSLLFVGIFLTLTGQEWDPMIKANNLLQVANSWNFCIQILVIYALYYNGKMPRRSWLIIAIMALYLLVVLKPSRLSVVSGPIALLLLFELFRMLILGIRYKKIGFWILFIGVVIQLTGFLLFVEDIFQLFPVMTVSLLILIVVFPQLGLPLTYSLHLAWEFGTANRNLRLQLTQVSTLSETTLRQEREKQEILAHQNETLENKVDERTQELSQQKDALQNTLIELKTTQSHLIQSEKMASLGELTAGIAHEIQNPLNFVNNFSDVNTELVEELKNELQADNKQEALLIADDIKENEQKINHHGKRADAIVKGMLQHSRTSSGKKEPTDINALADEYLRLSYYGLRAKDKDFNADFKTDFDESIGKIEVVPQDIGRVLLNLYNNAFYAVNEKKKAPTLKGENYEPTVWVTTKRISSPPDGGAGRLEISVRDNGIGIPQKVLDKIYQPFFTTKPTGQGTGLGLSLSYDIIKAHGGELKVQTKEGEHAEFIIDLPIKHS